MLAKQHHDMLMLKKKADKKKDADEVFKEWIRIVTLDSIVLSEDFGSIVSIDSKPVKAWNMVHLRALCSKFKISGYKNRKREEMVRLLLERKKNIDVERNHYAAAYDCDADDDDFVAAEADSGRDDDSEVPAVSSPVTRSTTAKAALSSAQTTKRMTGRKLLTMESSASKKPKKCKSTVPSAVTVDGTYYRAINVWFDERNRVEIVNMGASPSIRELDARKKFMNKSTYDKLLLTYLDNSIDNIAVDYIGFNDEYLNDCGIADQYAGEFDVLTSEDLCKVLEYVVYWYNVAYRNNRTSGKERARVVVPLPIIIFFTSRSSTSIVMTTGNHADFCQFVGSRPYVHYYHLWLVEIPHLSFLAVPQLSAPVFRISMTGKNKEPDDADSAISSEGSSSVSDDEGFPIVCPPPQTGLARQRKLSTTPTNTTSTASSSTGGTPGREAIRLQLLQSHMQTMEKIQNEAAKQRRDKDERDSHLALTVELKTIEEMLVMKKNELKAFDSSVDSDSEKDFVCEQIKKLRKKQRSLTALVYASDDEIIE